MISAARLQQAGEIVMVLGIVALCQPWNLFLHRYGVAIILVGLLTFMFTGWFGKPAGAQEEATDGVFDVSDHHDGKAVGHHDGVQTHQGGHQGNHP
jgi:hypothetical protein